MLGLMLQVGSFSFSDMLNQLENLGFFAYVLPFLLIFAVVYAILTKIPTFANNKGAGVLVAIAIGLLSLQLNFVPAFFQNLFPKFSIALALLLVGMILVGAIVPDDKTYRWVFFGIGLFAFIILTIVSLSSWQFVGSYWWSQYGALIVVVLVIAGAVVGVILASKGSATTT